MNQKKQGLSINQAILHRRSVTPLMFNNKEIDSKTIDLLMELANWAPTHRMTEPWRFVVISGASKERFGTLAAQAYKEHTRKFDELKFMKTKRKWERSSHVLAIVLHRDLNDRLPEWEEIAAVSMAVQNLWLASTQYNIGGYWSTPSWREGMDGALELEENETCMGFFYLGHYDVELPEGQRSHWKTKVRYMK